MKNYLVNATKKRLLLEIKDFISRHPVYKNIPVYNRYPYKERVQEGIILKNSSASRMPLSADNFQASVYSFVTLTGYKNSPSLSIEWAKEDALHLSNKIEKEDVSHQFTSINNVITLSQEIVKGQTDLFYANSFSDVEVYINNNRVVPSQVDGQKKTIILPTAPLINSKVEVTYWVRNLVAPGVYQFEVTEADPVTEKYAFMIDCLLDKEEILINSATGTETSTQLTYTPVYPNSLTLYENDELMSQGIDFNIDEMSGIISFINTPLTGSTIRAEYRVKGLTTGPFQIDQTNTSNNTALPGVILAFGRAISLYDKHFIIVTKDREHVADEYSGKWEMTFSLDVYAKDSIQVEEIIDLVTSYLLVYRKEQLDGEGLALVNCNFSGESEEVYDEVTNQQHYIGSIDYNLLTEWIMHKPAVMSVKGFNLTMAVLENAPVVVINPNTFERIR